MPTRIYKRLWCKACEEWTFFSKGFAKDSTTDCENCGKTFESLKLSEIPEEKVKEQRERYKKWKAQGLLSVPFLIGAAMNPLTGVGDEIIESPAGQHKIDERNREITKQRIEERRAAKAAQKAEEAKFAHLNRNDTCACGSGSKFKKCCLPRIRNMA